MKNILFQCAFICALLFQLTAHAQTIFDVEVVFFKRLDATANFNYLSQEDNLELEQSYSLLDPILLPDSYQLLERKERKLEGVFNRLRSSANMRPLFQVAWRQPLSDKDDTPWLSFNISDEPQEKGLEEFLGNLRFSRNQGLLFEASVSAFKAVDSNLVTEPTDEQTPEQLAGYFVLQESRKIKINTLTYFDHPTMGMLVKVTPYQATIEEQEALQAQQ